MIPITQTEELVYKWCTQKAKGSSSAHTLALIYVNTHMDKAHLLRLSELRALEKPQQEWAIALIQGYAEGWFSAPRRRALELMELYGMSYDQNEGL